MSSNPLLTLEALGQSVWLDDMRRGMLVSGALERLVREDGLTGVTVNPTILEKAISGSHDYDITSVASYFLSRIDVLVDQNLEKIRQAQQKQAERTASLRGRVAIASAKLAYEAYTAIFASSRFQALAQMGARTQALLWASTSTKSPKDSDVKYVEALIGPDTVNTMPLETLEAYRDHGQPAVRLDTGFDEAHRILESLPEVRIVIDDLARQLEDEGVRKFAASYDHLCAVLRDRRLEALHDPAW